MRNWWGRPHPNQFYLHETGKACQCVALNRFLVFPTSVFKISFAFKWSIAICYLIFPSPSPATLVWSHVFFLSGDKPALATMVNRQAIFQGRSWAFRLLTYCLTITWSMSPLRFDHLFTQAILQNKTWFKTCLLVQPNRQSFLSSLGESLFHVLSLVSFPNLA